MCLGTGQQDHAQKVTVLGEGLGWTEGGEGSPGQAGCLGTQQATHTSTLFYKKLFFQLFKILG